tara:strand:- start:41 stop:517 length:477 start_codon:yes stop_codon:yes gene_type:complete
LKIIKQIWLKDLSLVNKFIINQKKEFDKFTKLGWSNINIKNQFKKKNNFSIGYFYKNKMIGILLGDKIENNNNNFHLDIHIIFVSKNDRRGKVGTSILKFIETNKKLNNISKIYLEVSENNIDAIKFYEKNNFLFFKTRHNYYNNSKNINAKCYSKII